MPSAHQEIQRLLDARRRALLAGDADALAALLHRDFSYVDSLGRSLDRETYLASRREREIVFTRQDVSEVIIRETVPGRAVLITCIIDDAGTFRGAPFQSRCRTAHVCVHDGARWVFLFGQSTITPAPPSSQSAPGST